MFGQLNKDKAVIVFILTFLIYSPLLFNGFVGDDNVIIVSNTFYSSWKNIPRLFEKGYISDTRKINFNSASRVDLGSGSVSYRPVSNLTYFLDYYLFQARPYGSHLINVIIHCVNGVLVYLIVNEIFSSSSLGLFAALLFALHPIQSEAVAVMSYRADILAAMFALFSFYFWIKDWYIASLAMCFLALFSKESAIGLPFVIILFDQACAGPKKDFKRRGFYYLGFVAILAVFLYLYFIVFPNASMSFQWLGGSFASHCLLMGYIGHSYLMEVLLPWTVKMIPALYCPPFPNPVSLVTAGIIMTLMILMGCVLLLWRNYKEAVLFLIWFLIFYLPVSNLIPITNPMANRFMYLPSIGLLVFLAFFLHKALKSDFLKQYSSNLSGIFHTAIILLCITMTLFLNSEWKSNFYVGSAWVKDYPAFGRGYALLGVAYFNSGHFEKARQLLEKSVLLGDRIPLDMFYLARCCVQLGKPAAAKGLLEYLVRQYPDYEAPEILLKKVNLVLYIK